MRIFLLPVSTRRSLLYCERLHQVNPASRTLVDKAIAKANTTWATWERAEKGWKKSLTSYGNTVLRRIPYEEWGLKTMPALTEKRRKAELEKKEKFEVIFPPLFLKEDRVLGIIEKLATRAELHRKKLWWSIIGMPITAPFALVPIIPNIPFFYLVFRAYSHWKALSGAKHLTFLLKNNLLHLRPTAALDEVYTAGLMYPTRAISRASPYPTQEQITSVARLVEQQTNNGTEDVMVMQRWNGKLIAERFELPEMEVEIERAVEQVEGVIKSEEELKEEKEEIERATGTTMEDLKAKIKTEEGEKESGMTTTPTSSTSSVDTKAPPSSTPKSETDEKR